MSARADVQQLLRQWGDLSQAEAGAIQSATWVEVSRIQSTKVSLQASLSDALKLCLGGDQIVTLPPNDPLRLEAARLLSLEGRNAELLAEQFRRTRAEDELRRESLRNLRKLRRSYGHKSDGGWETLS